MATEYKLSYTAEEIDEKLRVVDTVSDAVLCVEQELTEEQKAQARANIGAIVDIADFSDNSIPLNKIDGINFDVDEGGVSVNSTDASVNIIDTDALIVGFNAGNSVTTHTGFCYTENIAVTTGDIIRYANGYDDHYTEGSAIYLAAFYASDGTYVKKWNHNNNVGTYDTQIIDGVETYVYEYVVEDNISFVSFNMHTSQIDKIMVTINNEMPSTYVAYGAVNANTNYKNFELTDKLFIRRMAKPPFNGFLKISYSQLWAYAPINTVSGYETAGFFGFDAIKGDVRLSADNVLIMCHDAGFTLDDSGLITTYDSGNCTLIHDMQSADILALEHAAYSMGEHPCTIDDYLQVCAKWNKIPFVTIRDEYMDIIAPLLVAALKRWNLLHCAIVNSFTVASLEVVRNLDRYIWLNQVMSRNLTSTDIETAERLYPCALSPYASSVNSTTEELQTAYDAMESYVLMCHEKGIPVLTAGGYTREQCNFYTAHYNGAQVNYITDFAPSYKYHIAIAKTDGVWEFIRNNSFEYSGTIEEADGVVYVSCAEIVPTWMQYLSPTYTAKCTSDTTVTVTAGYDWNSKRLKITPSTIVDGQKLLISVAF